MRFAIILADGTWQLEEDDFELTVYESKHSNHNTNLRVRFQVEQVWTSCRCHANTFKMFISIYDQVHYFQSSQQAPFSAPPAVVGASGTVAQPVKASKKRPREDPIEVSDLEESKPALKNKTCRSLSRSKQAQWLSNAYASDPVFQGLMTSASKSTATHTLATILPWISLAHRMANETPSEFKSRNPTLLAVGDALKRGNEWVGWAVNAQNMILKHGPEAAQPNPKVVSLLENASLSVMGVKSLLEKLTKAINEPTKEEGDSDVELVEGK